VTVVCPQACHRMPFFFCWSSRLATEATLIDGWMDGWMDGCVGVAQGRPCLDSEAKDSALVIFTVTVPEENVKVDRPTRIRKPNSKVSEPDWTQ
jgi:hypothetical protein